MEEAGSLAEAMIAACRVRMELARRHASWGETFAGALVLQAGAAACEFDRVEVALVWRTAELVMETVDGNPVWERLSVPAGESLRLLCFLKVPPGAHLGGAAEISVSFHTAGKRAQRMVVPVSIRTPSLFTRIAEELADMTALRMQEWQSLPSGRGAEAWFRAESGRPSPLAYAYLKLVPYRRVVMADIFLQRSPASLMAFLRHRLPGRMERVRVEFDEGGVEMVRELLEERLRPSLSAAAGLPRPARSPLTDPDLLPGPADAPEEPF